MISNRRHFEVLRAADQEALRLRDQINSERGRYITESDYDRRHEALRERISKLEAWQANLTGRMVVFSLVGLVIVASASALVTHILSST